MLAAIPSSAQDKNITGVILDETSTGIAGAYVVVKGETRGAMTDENGQFNISVSPSDVLVASFLGYIDQEIKVGDQSKVVFNLVPAANELDGVVKVAYGTQRKASVIGSISTVACTRYTHGMFLSERQVATASFAVSINCSIILSETPR